MIRECKGQAAKLCAVHSKRSRGRLLDTQILGWEWSSVLKASLNSATVPWLDKICFSMPEQCEASDFFLIFETHQTLDTTSSNDGVQRHSRRQEGTLWWSNECQVGSQWPRKPFLWPVWIGPTSLNDKVHIQDKVFEKGDGERRHPTCCIAMFFLQWLLNS